jgi:hypothetical protein
VAAILLWLTWPVCLVNRIWNNAPFKPVKWIIFDKTVDQDWRWYLVYNELWLSAFFVILAMLIMKYRTHTIILLLWALFFVAIVDIVNYWLWFRRNEIALGLEGLIMVAFSAIIFTKSQK